MREKLKKSEEELEFHGSVRELRELLKNKYPELSHLIDRMRLAVNEEYVDEDYTISERDVVALIPPVSGG